MNKESKTWKLRMRIVRHCQLLFTDQSTNPKYWNCWNVPLSPGYVRVFLQRWCRGYKHGHVNYIRVTRDNGERLLLRELQVFANWLTDQHAAKR